jgi:hypothetical protein
MWSSVSIPGAPRILLVDATRNYQGWENAFSDRLYAGLQRTELQMQGKAPVRAGDPSELTVCLSDFVFNCLILFAHAESQQAGPGAELGIFWNWLGLQPQLPLFLLAVLSCPGFNPQVSEEILKSIPVVAPLAIAPLSPMAPREAGLFYLKFFTELKLHSTDNISGKMVWFSFSKARELLRRRRYSARFGVRC